MSVIHDLVKTDKAKTSGRLWAFLEEPAAFDTTSPAFSVAYDLFVGFNQDGSVWLSSDGGYFVILVRSWSGHTIRKSSPSHLVRASRCSLVYTQPRTTPGHSQFAFLVALYPSGSHYRTVLINLNSLEVRLGVEIPHSDLQGFSSNGKFFFSKDRRRTYRTRFDLESLNWSGISHRSTLTQISTGHPLTILDSGDLVLYFETTGKHQIWKMNGRLDDLSDEDAAALRAWIPKPKFAGWFQRNLYPIVFASHSLVTRSLASLADCDPSDKDAVRARLPDDQTKNLFDGFHEWHLRLG
jgi:hypothetical protein